MYRAFNLIVSDWKNITESRSASVLKAADVIREYQRRCSSAEAIYEQNSNIVKRTLEAFLDKSNGKIDGSKMREHWFPQIKADVFISHSHADCDVAIKLADYLKRNFKLNSFVDSCVWDHANDLLKLIDNQYCTNDKGKTYIYENRNGSTSHVHMMLSTALGEMLDACECAIFINTPSSITSEKSTMEINSPWIYFELGLMRLIREQIPERIQKLDESITNMSKRAALPIGYTVDLSNLTEIDDSDLSDWAKQFDYLQTRGLEGSHPLDIIYRLAPAKSQPVE